MVESVIYRSEVKSYQIDATEPKNPMKKADTWSWKPVQPVRNYQFVGSLRVTQDGRVGKEFELSY